MDYSPSAQTAWESVNYIQNEMWGGWLLRGCIITRRRSCRCCWRCICCKSSFTALTRRRAEVNFWFGLILLQLVFDDGIDGLSTAVGPEGIFGDEGELNLLGIVPLIGPACREY